jgi:glycosyltransferase involved in cell wall biosynthesis
MRIGFFTDNYFPSRDGIAISIETFQAELEKLGHEVFIIAPSPTLRYKEKSKKIIRFPAFKGLFYEDYLTSLFIPPQATRRIDKLKLDIVHYHTPGQVGFLGAYYAIRNNLPLVTTYHTDLYEYVKHYKNTLPGIIALSLLAPIITGGGLADYRTGLSLIKPERNVDKWNQKIVERGITMIHNACDMVIAPSDKVKMLLEKWDSRSPISVLPTGVDKITTTTKEIAAWRSKLNIPEGTQVIAFVGRLGTEKNLNLLLKSFEIINKKNPNAKLLVIGGTGSNTETTQGAVLEDMKSSSAKDNVIFTGFVEHNKLGGLYGLSTIFAFPSLTDTQGLVLNEAAYAGLPIVMIDSEITEVVKDRINGRIAKSNAKDFANKLLEILNSEDLQKSMGAKSLALASEYNASNQTLKLLRLYKEVIEIHYANKPKSKQRSFWSRKSAT